MGALRIGTQNPSKLSTQNPSKTGPWFAHAIAGGVFLGLQFWGQTFPELILRFFSIPAGWLATQFWGAPSEVTSLGLEIHHPTIPVSVTLACSGFTFFTILFCLLLGFSIHQKMKRYFILWVLATYLLTLLANSARIITAVESRIVTDTWFPANYQSILHTTVGAVVFLTVTIFFWLSLNFIHGKTKS